MTTLAELKTPGVVTLVDIQKIIAYKEMMNDIELKNTPGGGK